MSVNAVDWALRFAPVDARHNGAARVLMCLANVADDEGRNAHPTHRKLAAWCKCSVSTVKRHLSWLEANGLIRRGDQRQAGHFSEWHRPVVWDLCLGNRLELDPDFFDSNDIDSTRGGRPSTENKAKGNPGSPVDLDSDTESGDNHGSPVNRGYGEGDAGKPQLTGEPRFTTVTPPPAHLVSYSTSLVRNNPSAPTGHLPASGETTPDEDDGDWQSEPWTDAAAEAEPPESESVKACSDAEMVCRTMADGLRAMPPMPVPDPLARPGKRELAAAQRLIARHGMPLVLAVAEWVSLPPSKTDKGDASGKPYDGFWRRTLTGPRSLARHWDQVCLQMADDPHGRRLLAGHGVIADKGETAQPPSAESTPKAPNYGIPDNLDRRVWKLLDPYDFDAGNDGFEAPRTLRRLLKRVPANDAEGERNAVLEALRAGRAFLDAESREKDDGFGQRKPSETGPASVRFGFIGGRGPKEVPACS